ncbi:MAG: nicotinate-nucleotide--dimethylbenzimidazole phosphoribosyltransferase [Firmicutes bacterium]|nr:nicotinate-nucleotide--dimethylbenzimidazole phosphoribosyltransferase [Bacillota bacterium]
MKEHTELKDIIERITGLKEDAVSEAKKRQDYLAKVPGSLGKLEEISIRLAGITGKPFGNDVRDQAIILMCADNGVVEEGVASAPQSVTLMQTVNFTKGITGVSSQAKYFGIDILTIDVGVKLPIPPEYITTSMMTEDDSKKPTLSKLVVDRRIADGTKNFAKEPAMTREEAIRAIMIGVEAASACKKAGKNLIGIGEMGIGNTSTSSAIIAALSLYADAKSSRESSQDTSSKKENLDETHVNKLIENIVGRGGGLSDSGLAKKCEVIKNALLKYEPLYLSDGELDAIELLSAVGGFDIAAMTGAYLGAAMHRIPAVIDGVISIAAALVATMICPTVKDYLFTSHKSKEGGYMVASELLEIEPMYDLGMRLGEGSGCPIAFKIIEAASAAMNGMKSLDEAKIDAEYLDEFREDGQFQ